MRHRQRRPPTSPEQRAKLSAKATVQHAARRGYEVRPEDRRAYHNAFRVLRKHGLTREEAATELRTAFEETPPSPSR